MQSVYAWTETLPPVQCQYKVASFIERFGIKLSWFIDIQKKFFFFTFLSLSHGHDTQKRRTRRNFLSFILKIVSLLQYSVIFNCYFE